MYRLLLLVDLWIIAATNDPEKLTNLINRTPLILSDKLDKFHFPKRAGITADQQQEYYHLKPHDEEYFCPFETNTKNRDLKSDIKELNVPEFEYCLFKKKFKKEETPMCKKEAKPLLVQIRDKLGQKLCGSGLLYKFVYEVCVVKSRMTKFWQVIEMRKTPKGNVFSDVRQPALYEVCYDNWNSIGFETNPRIFNGPKTNNRTLFTKHKIRSPYILRNLILQEENSLHYYPDMYSTETYGLKTLEKLKKNLEAYNKQKDNEAETIKRKLEEAYARNTTPEYTHTYVLEMLVPLDDFALGHWKKALYHMINYSPLNTLMVPLWRAINLHVRNRIIELYDEIGDVDIYTGTYKETLSNDNEIIYLGNDQEAGVTIPGIWWKLVYVRAGFKEHAHKGLVIIMHTAGDPKPICNKEIRACDPMKWEIRFDQSYYKYVYCCSVKSAFESISTIRQLGLKYIKQIRLFKLDYE